MTLLLQSLTYVKKLELARGDKVVASSGDFIGLTGTVSHITGDEIQVALDAHLRTDGIPDELLFNIRDLVKRYDIGDSVVVSNGKEAGSSGVVIAIGIIHILHFLSLCHGVDAYCFCRCRHTYSYDPA